MKKALKLLITKASLEADIRLLKVLLLQLYTYYVINTLLRARSIYECNQAIVIDAMRRTPISIKLPSFT